MTGVLCGITLVLMSESGGQWPRACATSMAGRASAPTPARKNGFMRYNYRLTQFFATGGRGLGPFLTGGGANRKGPQGGPCDPSGVAQANYAAHSQRTSSMCSADAPSQ